MLYAGYIDDTLKIIKKKDINYFLNQFNSFDKNLKFVEILQLRAKFETAMVSCSRFIRITNFSDHKRVLTANLLHTKSLPNPLGHQVSG